MEVETMRCAKCWQRFDEADSHCVYYGSTVEPPEYVLKCPHCGAIDCGQNTVIRMEWKIVCECCTEVEVREDRTLCADCEEAVSVERIND